MPSPQTPLPLLAEGPCRFTPARANHVYNTMRYARNRPEHRAPNHIAALARQMASGKWLDRSQLDFARLPDGSLTLVNGHHRMLAQVQAGTDIVWNVVIHDVPDEAALHDLYWRFDTVLRKRSINNVVSAIGLDTELGVPKQIANALMGAAALIDSSFGAKMNDYRRAGLTPDERLDLARLWGREARAFAGCIKAANLIMGRKLRSTQIMAVALVTLRAESPLAELFWRSLSEDDGLKRGDPRKTFVTWLLTTHLTGSSTTSASVLAARCWNAFYEERELHVARIGSQPVRIACTNYEVAP